MNISDILRFLYRDMKIFVIFRDDKVSGSVHIVVECFLQT